MAMQVRLKGEGRVIDRVKGLEEVSWMEVGVGGVNER